MAGIALGVAALIVVLSVMNGFQKEVRDRMLSVLPHIELYIPGAAPERVLDQWRQYADAAKKNPAVKAGAPFVAAQGMLVRGQALRGVQVRGIDPATEGGVSDLPRQMVTGKLSDLKPGGFGVVLGNELADGMGVKVGDTLMMMAPQGSISPPASRRACVSSPWWACSLPATTNTIPRWPSLTTRTPPACSATAAGRRARGRHAEGARGGRRAGPGAAALHDGQRLVPQQPHLVRRGQDRKAHDVPDPGADRGRGRVQPAVLAGDGRQDKQSDIAILRTLGAGPGEVARIFLVQGALIGVIGTLLGVAGGIAIAYNVDVIVPFIERLLGVQFLPREVYFISALPSDPQVSDIVTIGLTSLVLSLLATLYPSWRASRLQPAQVLRHD